jgi:hypothetical protein
MQSSFAAWLAIGVFVFAGCNGRTAPMFLPRLTDVAAEPADPTTRTPVSINFCVSYTLESGHTNQVMREIVVEAKRPGAPMMAKVLRVPLGGRPIAGTIDLGELPAGEHEVVVAMRAQQNPESWWDLPLKTLTVKVREADEDTVKKAPAGCGP